MNRKCEELLSELGQSGFIQSKEVIAMKEKLLKSLVQLTVFALPLLLTFAAMAATGKVK